MESLVLKKVEIEYGDDIFSYKNEFIYSNESMDGTGFFLQYGGHIGYSVRKSERNKGYAKEELRQALIYCKDVLHIGRVLLTCNNDNFASQKTILSQRGKKENEVLIKDENCVVERYWIDL